MTIPVATHNTFTFEQRLPSPFPSLYYLNISYEKKIFGHGADALFVINKKYRAYIQSIHICAIDCVFCCLTTDSALEDVVIGS